MDEQFALPNIPAPTIKPDAGQLLSQTIATEPKRKRGRPPMPRDAQGNIIQPTNAPNQTVPVAPVSSESVRKSVEALIRFGDAALQKSFLALAVQIDDKTVEAVKSAAITPEEQTAIAELASSVIDKYQLAQQYLPETLLIGTLALYGYRQYQLYDGLKSLLSERLNTTTNASTAPREN